MFPILRLLRKMGVIKRGTNDEFYTHYEGIEILFDKYVDENNIIGKKIYCNCDDYRMSNFVKYFKDNFDKYELKELIATNYDIGDGAYIYTYDGENETVTEGIEDGSFEHYDYLLDDDTVIVTNPPFSQSRKYFEYLYTNNTHFIVLNTLTQIAKFGKGHYNELYGVKTAHYIFYYTNDDSYADKDKKHIVTSTAISNMRFKDTPSKIYELTYKYDDCERKHLDEWNGKRKNILECKYCKKIPNDYYDLMAVPISFLWLNNDIRDMFEIVDMTCLEHTFYRFLIKRKLNTMTDS